MKSSNTLSFGVKVLIFLTAFIIVLLYNFYVAPELGINLRFWFRTGDYFSVAVVLAETLILGFILRWLVVMTFKMQFERREK